MKVNKIQKLTVAFLGELSTQIRYHT